MRYSTVLFDLDHTLFDFDASELAAFASALAIAGLTDASAHLATYQRLNNALWAAAERGEIRSTEIRNIRFQQLLTELELQADAATVGAVADMFVAGLGDHGELFPGARPLLDSLAATVRLGLISNGLAEVVHARLARLAIEPLFEVVVVSSEVGASKPQPAIFDVAFERLGNPARSSVLMVGDSLTSDIAGGRAYGLDTCWYNPHGRVAGPADLFTHEVRELSEVLALVR
jgi:2-haloacid dehalogenase